MYDTFTEKFNNEAEIENGLATKYGYMLPKLEISLDRNNIDKHKPTILSKI